MKWSTLALLSCVAIGQANEQDAIPTAGDVDVHIPDTAFLRNPELEALPITNDSEGSDRVSDELSDPIKPITDLPIVQTPTVEASEGSDIVSDDLVDPIVPVEEIPLSHLPPAEIPPPDLGQYEKGYNLLLSFSDSSATGSRRRLQVDSVNEELQKASEYQKLLPTNRGGLQTSSTSDFNQFTVPTLIKKYFNGKFVSFYDKKDFPELAYENNIRSIESLNGVGIYIVNFRTKEQAEKFLKMYQDSEDFHFIEHEVDNSAIIPEEDEPHKDAPTPIPPLRSDLSKDSLDDEGIYEYQQIAFTPIPLPDENEQQQVPGDDEFVPNDPYFSRLWGFRQNNGIDMKVSKMWKKFRPETTLVEPIVAVLDSGTDMDHPDLVDRHWVNWAEFYGKPGVDDDGNGYVDDINGYNFITMTPAIHETSNSHGTHCAGSVLASGNNKEGVVGGFYTARLMTAQMLNSQGTGPSGASARAVNYAMANGAHIASCSWTGSFSSTMFNTIKNSPMLHVCAAGNGGRNMDSDPRYPAGYTATHDNVLSVGAFHSTGVIASFSNWGTKTVDVFAPGTYIVSTCIDNDYCTASGTSMATPNAAGIAAALYAKGLSMAKAVNAPSSVVGPFPADVKKILIDTSAYLAALADRSKSKGIINANAALDAMEDLMEGRLNLLRKDCQIGAWSAWSQCSVTCGVNGGVRTRTRTNIPPEFGGAACPTDNTQTEVCNKGVSCGTDCVISDWSNWSTCTATCGGGNQTRTRTVTPATGNGKACPANTPTTDSRTCNTQSCAKDCVIGDWSDWSQCSTTCGPGVQVRERELTPPVNGGKACPSNSKETKTCEVAACTCTFGDWSEWTECSATCGYGTRRRSRSAKAPGCSKSETQVNSCYNGACPKK